MKKQSSSLPSIPISTSISISISNFEEASSSSSSSSSSLDDDDDDDDDDVKRRQLTRETRDWRKKADSTVTIGSEKKDESDDDCSRFLKG